MLIESSRVLLVCFTFFLTQVSYSQQDVREEFSYNATFLTQTPPISGQMPLETILSYIVADSACRSATFENLAYAGRMADLDEALFFLRYYNQIVEYNPILFRNTLLSTHFDYMDSANNVYLSKYAGLIRGLQFAVDKHIDSIGVGTAMTGLSDYIVYGVVESVDRFSDGVFDEKDSAFVVQLSVIDTIKGTHFPLACEYPNSLTSPSPCFRFGGYQYRSVGIDYTSDSRENLDYGYEDVSVGDTVVVFTEICYYGYDKFSVEPFRNYNRQGGIFVVDNGIVADVQDSFGLGTNARVEDFLLEITKSLDVIRNAVEPTY